jgi:hypothetical protein
MDVLAVIIVLAIVIEKIIERVKDAGVKAPAWVWFGVGSVIGIALCLIFEISAFKTLGIGAYTDAAFYAGSVITGIAIGGGSNLVHDVFDALNK